MTTKEFNERFSYNKSTDRLGKGGFGTVFKAWDNANDCYVALKMQPVNPDFPTARLKAEVERAETLNHRNVAKYKECYTFETMEGSMDVAVMSYYEDGSLEHLIVKQQLNDKERESILCQLLEGIAYLHTHDIIHRDLKPQNILILHHGGSYTPKITDFGISKQLHDGESGSVSNSLPIMSRPYASPEQLLGGTIKKNTDLWSFGVIAYLMFTGSLPFNAGSFNFESLTDREAFYNLLKSGQLPDAVATIPEPWQRLIRACLTANTKLRPAHAEDCLQILNTFKEVVPEPPVSPEPPEPEEEIYVAEVIEATPEDLATESEPKPATEPEPKPATEPEVKPNPGPKVESNPNFTKPKTKKRSKWWLWLLIVAAGVGVWFMSSPKNEPSPSTAEEPTEEQSTTREKIQPVVIEEVEPTPAPVLRLTSNNRITTEHSGTNGTIRYTLENPVSGVNISVSDNANWLTTSVSGSTISYTASANESQSSRTATITVRYGDQSFEVVITQNGRPAPAPTTGTANGHDWVDLGLPSGLKWATCNVGASNPGDYGNYYAWGETTTNSSYDSSNCSTWNQNIGDIAGTIRDAARQNWGGRWRMPRWRDFQELLDNCTWTWTTQDGHDGYRITGPNGNSIFLPAAGYRYGSSSHFVGSFGHYWSSTPYESSTLDAYYLGFFSGHLSRGWDVRYDGLSVRPVLE